MTAAGDGAAEHHTLIRDAFLRSGRPINTVRQLEKGLRIPRTPKTPAKTPAAPKTYTSGDRVYKMPPCGLEGAHSGPVGPGRVSVKAAFSGATLFITGASGYVGSVVLEQLLRVCPDVARIYLLIRGKRGSTGKSPIRSGRLCMHAGLQVATAAALSTPHTTLRLQALPVGSLQQCTLQLSIVVLPLTCR